MRLPSSMPMVDLPLLLMIASKSVKAVVEIYETCPPTVIDENRTLIEPNLTKWWSPIFPCIPKVFDSRLSLIGMTWDVRVLNEVKEYWTSYHWMSGLGQDKSKTMETIACRYNFRPGTTAGQESEWITNEWLEGMCHVVDQPSTYILGIDGASRSYTMSV